MLVDLHTHTTSSDGTLKPREIVEMAKLMGIEVLAITDHDTVSAFDEINGLYENDEEITVIMGVEISAEYPTDSLHILGFNFKNIKKIGMVLDELIKYRNKRNEIILEKMNAMGFQVNFDEIKQIARGEAIGRPHFARIMVHKGYVKSIEEAFESYLKDGKPLFVEKKRLKPEEAIKLIKEAGGIAILAHPYEILKGESIIRLTENMGILQDESAFLENYIKKLVNYGLDGIEAFYSTHTHYHVNKLLEIAKKYDLMITAGSDFHGDNRSSVKLGMNIPYKLLKKFLNAL